MLALVLLHALALVVLYVMLLVKTTKQHEIP